MNVRQTFDGIQLFRHFIKTKKSTLRWRPLYIQSMGGAKGKVMGSLTSVRFILW